ncbi:MAG: hypothetical protein C4548_11070 [Desulfobacteraceae bacterium]|nr:MAG: hypothetical protein C4548_11070 [Desulfobacteraceae bacterium]
MFGLLIPFPNVNPVQAGGKAQIMSERSLMIYMIWMPCQEKSRWETIVGKRTDFIDSDVKK